MLGYILPVPTGKPTTCTCTLHVPDEALHCYVDYTSYRCRATRGKKKSTDGDARARRRRRPATAPINFCFNHNKRRADHEEQMLRGRYDNPPCKLSYCLKRKYMQRARVYFSTEKSGGHASPDVECRRRTFRCCRLRRRSC